MSNSSIELPKNKIPKHVAIIMDGNGRWANSKNKPRYLGHQAGLEAVRETVQAAVTIGIENLTLFAFSSENWARPQEEISALMRLFIEALKIEVKELHKNNVKLSFIGNINILNRPLREKISEAEHCTKNNKGLKLTVAMAYGGRWDIIEASKSLMRQVEIGELEINDLNDELFAAELQTAKVPNPDLLIRTGGEQRISNFLLWDLAYAELLFLSQMWPDFDMELLKNSINEYNKRKRNFGGNEL